MATTVTDGAGAPAADDAYAGFRASFAGEVAAPDDPGYDAARQVWNGNVDRRPALIARCRGVADVQAARRLRPRAPASPLSVRGGGHSAPGYGTNDGGLVHRPLADEGHPRRPRRPHGPRRGRRAVARARPGDAGVRPSDDRRHRVEHRHRRADAGRRSRLADGQARADRRQPALRRRRHRRRGLPDGERGARARTCSGRCAAAAATSASSRRSSTACTRSTEVLGGLVVHPLARRGDVLRFYREFCADAARRGGGLLRAPHPPRGGHPGRRRCCSATTARRPRASGSCAPAREFGQPLADLVAPMPYSARQSMLDEPNAIHGLHRYWRSAFTEQLDDGLFDAMVEEAAAFSSPLSALLFFYLHGAATRVPVGDTAFAARRPQWDFDAIGCWGDAAESDRHISWVKSAWDRFEPHLRATPTSTTSALTTRRRRCGPPTAQTTSGCGSSRASTTRRTCSGSTRTSSRADRPGGRPAPRLADSPDGRDGPLRAGRCGGQGHHAPPEVPQRTVPGAARGARRGVRPGDGRPRRAGRGAVRERAELVVRPRHRHARGAGRPPGPALSARHGGHLPALLGLERREHAALAGPAQADHRRGAGHVHLRRLDDRLGHGPDRGGGRRPLHPLPLPVPVHAMGHRRPAGEGRHVGAGPAHRSAGRRAGLRFGGLAGRRAGRAGDGKGEPHRRARPASSPR